MVEVLWDPVEEAAQRPAELAPEPRRGLAVHLGFDRVVASEVNRIRAKPAFNTTNTVAIEAPILLLMFRLKLHQ